MRHTHHVMPNLFQRAIFGEDTDTRQFRNSRLRHCQWIAGEDGLMSWATLVAVICFVALTGVVFHVGRIANDKLETQNAADSVAYSSSLVQARAMNAITATNHMIGELTALYTMHHAIGGKVLDERRKKNNLVVLGLNLALFGIHKGALIAYGIVAPQLAFPGVPVGLPHFPASYGPSDDVPRGEASVYDAKCLLKEKLIEQYVKHIDGTWKLQSGIALTYSIWPPTVAKGWSRIGDGQRTRSEANREIRALVREYRFINDLEQFAISTRDIKKKVVGKLIDALWAYERFIAGDLIPTFGAERECAEAARFVAQSNRCQGEVLGQLNGRNLAFALAGQSTATLPIVKDPTSNQKRTQLIRATYPWVQDWRSPLLAAFRLVAPRSRVTVFYEYHTDNYTKQICHAFRRDRGIKLFVLQEMDASRSSTDKGRESWRKVEGSSKANKIFCLLAAARKETPPAMSHGHILPVTNPTPVASVSQAMIYNANEPKRWRRKSYDIISWLLRRRAQPVPAWDTLNWTKGATEWKNGKSYYEWMPFKDLRWVVGRVTFVDFLAPPDIRMPFVPIGPPAPEVQLNWQAKLVPVSTGNLLRRTPLVQDEDISKRLQQQVWAGFVAENVGLPVINH